MAQSTESSSADGLAALAESASALLDSLYDSAPIGLGFWDLELRYVRVNEALAEINELAPEAHVGKTFAEVIPQLAPVIEPIARRVLETGEAVVALEISGGTPGSPEKIRDWLASYYPVRSREGKTLGVGAVIEEVTARRKAERETAMAHQATHVLAESESVAEAVTRLLETVCTAIGWDVGCYWPVDPSEPRRTWVREGVGADGFVALTERASLETSLVPGRVAATGEAEWLADLSPERVARASIADAEGLKSGLALPVVAEGEVHGVIELFAATRRSHEPDLLASLSAIATQLGQFLLRKRAEDERANLLRRERESRAEAESAATTLRKLQRVSEVALTQRSLPRLLASLLERIVEVLDAETSAILLVSDDGLLRVRATVGLDEQIGLAVPIPVGAGMAGRVAATRSVARHPRPERGRAREPGAPLPAGSTRSSRSRSSWRIR